MTPQCHAVAKDFLESDSWISSLQPEQKDTRGNTVNLRHQIFVLLIVHIHIDNVFTGRAFFKQYAVY